LSSYCWSQIGFLGSHSTVLNINQGLSRSFSGVFHVEIQSVTLRSSVALGQNGNWAEHGQSKTAETIEIHVDKEYALA